MLIANIRRNRCAQVMAARVCDCVIAESHDMGLRTRHSAHIRKRSMDIDEMFT
jgi:hypothetical protein